MKTWTKKTELSNMIIWYSIKRWRGNNLRFFYTFLNVILSYIKSFMNHYQNIYGKYIRCNRTATSFGFRSFFWHGTSPRCSRGSPSSGIWISLLRNLYINIKDKIAKKN